MLKTNLQDLGLLQAPARRLGGADNDFDPLIDLAGGASFVLLGEASHGTHEFYATRAEITRRLIREKGFQAVAAEADWPAAPSRATVGRSEMAEPAYQGPFPSN